MSDELERLLLRWRYDDLHSKTSLEMAELLSAYILAEIRDAKPSIQPVDANESDRAFFQKSGYNEGIDDFEANLMVRFGPQGDTRRETA